MRKFFASALPTIVILAGTGLMLSACNTAAGFGQDMKNAGQAITNSAQKTQNGSSTSSQQPATSPKPAASQ
jgi:entericidin B